MGFIISPEVIEVVLGSSRAVRLIDMPAGDEDERKKRESKERLRRTTCSVRCGLTAHMFET